MMKNKSWSIIIQNIKKELLKTDVLVYEDIRSYIYWKAKLEKNKERIKQILKIN